MAAEGDAGGMTGYIKHHLEHLTVSVGDSPFMTLNIDSIFFKLLLAVLFFEYCKLVRKFEHELNLAFLVAPFLIEGRTLVDDLDAACDVCSFWSDLADT